MNPLVGILVTVVLLAINAFFVAAEFAVTSSRLAQIEPLKAQGKKGADKAYYALQHVSLMLATCQLGVTVMSTSLGAVAEPAVAHLLAVPLGALGINEATTHAISFVIALLIVLFLHVVFGEMVPKNISIASPEKMVLALAPPLVALGHIFRPLVVGMDNMANTVLRWFHVEPSSEISATFTLDEVANIVQVSQEEGKIEDQLGLLTGTLEFSQKTAVEVMVAASDLVTLPDDCTPADVEALVAQTGYSRFPVAGPEGNLVGYLHLKDVLYARGEERNQPVTPWRIRELRALSADTEIEDALRMMQMAGIHMAEVTTTGGRAWGVLFLEDVLELLVGEVRDSIQRLD